jgi:hypothetical protein
MAYTKYSLTPADNNAAPPNGAPEGMLPSAVNDTMRDMMSQIRDAGDGIRGGTYTMTAPVITGGSITGVALSGNTLTSPVITGGSINNTPVGATTASTGAFTTLAASGATTLSSNLAFTGTGNRITGDFSNTTKENRVWIQTSTTNNGTGVYIVPNGTSIDAGSTVFNASNLTNAGYFNFSINNTAASIDSGRFGSGTFLPITFLTSGSERMRLSTSGYLSVGSTASEGLITSDGGPTVGGTVLAVKGGNSVSQCAQIGFYNTFAGTPTPNKFIRVNNAGELEIINSDYSATIFTFTNGGAAFNTTGTWGTISDARVKENVETARNYLSDLCRLRVVKYSLKSEESEVPTKLGFVAQEVEQVFPNMVEESLDTFGDLGNIKQIKLSVLTPMLVKAIQELKSELDSVKAELATLKA